MCIPKSDKCKLPNSLNVDTLCIPIFCIKASLVGEYSSISYTLSDIASATSDVMYNPDCSICLVAVLLLAAAIF